MVEPIEKTFADIASIMPTQRATERAIAKVRAALESRRRRWLLPTSLAAAILLLAVLLPLLFQTRASAAERLAQAINTTQAYQGWITMTFDDVIYCLNTKTHATVYQHIDQGKISIIYYQNPATGEYTHYDAAKNLISLSTLSPNGLLTLSQQAAGNPASYSDLLVYLKQTLNVNVANITAKSDAGLDRYDIGAAISAATRPKKFLSSEFPTTVWVDPHTGRIAKTLHDGITITFTYGDPAIHSIYDAGAPRTAKVLDIRPSREAMAVVDRIRKLQTTPFPDGACAYYYERDSTESPKKSSGFTLYAKAGDHWIKRRFYHLRLAGDNDAGHLDLPNDWTATGADELFRRVSQASADAEEGGDDKSAVSYDYFYHQEYHFLNPVAQNLAMINLPGRNLYPLESDYRPDRRLDLITSPDRPGQLGLDFTAMFGSRYEDEYWIDPTHGDRFISRIETAYSEHDASKIEWKQITEFSNYQTLPPPDDRSYPATWTLTQYESDKEGKFVPSSHQTTTFHFFPGKTLPELEKKFK